MGSDHKRCDDLFLAAEKAVAAGDWSNAQKQYGEFHKAVEKHFSMEEQVLFPDFERAHGSAIGPTQVMRLEHEQMRGLIRALQQALAAEDKDAFLGEADTLLVLMQQHNAKEEMMLYPMTDQMLAGQGDEVISRMQSLEEA
jgi:hemerythrin-like domain-containing protein